MRLTESRIATLMVVVIVTATPPAHAQNHVENVEAHKTLARLSVDHIDFILNSVAQSTQAVAAELVSAHRAVATRTADQPPPQAPAHLASGQTVLFQTWPGALQPAPEFQADHAGFYSYRGQTVDDETLFQLQVFQALTPAVRSAYSSFPFSWSYVTTADGMMLIYPFLTLEEAVNNEFPTDQTYYTHADFQHRSTGWTPPYLDLVGAGMMVTASTPAFEGDTLLGVCSHDITLAQISESVLKLLTRDVGGTAWLVDASGLVIGVSDADLEAELERVNKGAGKAVLHYRLSPTAGLAGARSGQHASVEISVGQSGDGEGHQPIASSLRRQGHPFFETGG
ncbi:MAG: hypothetical protein P8Y44_06040 [Acidobacteriota bacterium]